MASDAAFLLPGIHDDAALMCLAMLPRGCYGVLKCVNRRWKAALEDEHLYSLREELQRQETWVYINVYHHPPPSTTTASPSSSHSSFRGGKPPSQIRVDSLYAFSPILDRWFRLSESSSPRSSRRIKTVAVKHKQYIFGDGLVIRDAITGVCTRGPQLPSDAFLNMQLAASDSHVVLVSTTPQVISGIFDSFGDVVAHVLAVDEAGMPHGDWKQLPRRRWMGVISLLAHEGGLWHLIGREAQLGGGERHMVSFDPYTQQWIEMRAALLDGHTRVSSPGEGRGGCHKQLLWQAAAACEALRRGRPRLRRSLLVLQGKDLKVEMRRLLTPARLAIDDSGREPGGEKEGKESAKVGLVVNEENVVRLMASGGTGMFRIIGDQMMIIPVSACGGFLTGAAGCEGLDAGIGAADACGTFESKPPSQIRVDSLYAFSPILNRWFRLSETISSRASRFVKTVVVKHKQYIFGDDLIIRDAVTGACKRAPQLPSGAHLNIQLAASDSHVVFVSASPQIVFGESNSPGDVFVHVLAVSADGMATLLCLCWWMKQACHMESGRNFLHAGGRALSLCLPMREVSGT
ncbi:unnamed protein product [Closterium sp. Yama58-4]|nr:unnamed protein product [Closterium sp. Yama58-4]